jgi:hypothetical protein
VNEVYQELYVVYWRFWNNAVAQIEDVAATTGYLIQQ